MAGNLSALARANARLRYSPQREVLQLALGEAKNQYASTVSGGETAGRITRQAVESAKPNVSAIYDRNEKATAAEQERLGAILSALGPSVNGFKAASATESQAGVEKSGRERAAAEGSLEQQDIAAKQAPVYARQQAGQQLQASLAKILGSLQGVAGQEGLATTTELGKLENQAEGRSLTERGQNLSHEDRAAARAQKAQEHRETLAAKGPRGGTYLSQDKQTAAASTLREIEKEARGLSQEGVPRNQIFEELTNAHPGGNTEKRNEKGEVLKNSKGEVQYEKTALKAHDALLAEAALDSVTGYGRVSRATLVKLHNAGYSLKALGLQGPGPKPPKDKTGLSHLGKRVAAALPKL